MKEQQTDRGLNNEGQTDKTKEQWTEQKNDRQNGRNTDGMKECQRTKKHQTE